MRLSSTIMKMNSTILTSPSTSSPRTTSTNHSRSLYCWIVLILYSVAVICVLRDQSIVALIEKLIQSEPLIFAPEFSISRDLMLPTSEAKSMISPINTLPTAWIVLETVGEFGNHLQLLPFGLAFREWLQEEYYYDSSHQLASGTISLSVRQRVGNLQKSKPTVEKLQRCFPRLRETIQFMDPLSNTSTWKDREEPLSKNSSQTHSDIEMALSQSPTIEVKYPFDLNRPAIEKVLYANQDNQANLSRLIFHLPLKNNPRKRETHLQNYFQLDYDSCGCSGENATLVGTHETLLHVRGFQTEVSNWEEKRLYDLDPQNVADSLLGHLHPKIDSVAILGRFSESLDPYVDALEKRGIATRKISGQTDLQDFCLLSRHSKVAGQMRSTFFTHAVLLNQNLDRVDAYEIIDNQRSRNYRPCRNMANNETIFCHVFNA